MPENLNNLPVITSPNNNTFFVKHKKFLLIVSPIILVSIIIIAVSLYLTPSENKQKDQITEKTNKIVLDENVPLWNTADLRDAKKGENYKEVVASSLYNSYDQLTASASGLPKGLSLGNCVNTKNVDKIPKPNNVLTCLITGIPEETGQFKVRLESVHKGYVRYVIIPLTVNP